MSNTPKARSREWAPTLDVEKTGAFSLQEVVAITTPLISLATLLAMPAADARSRARVASGLLWARNIVSWASDWDGEGTEEITLTDSEMLAVEEKRSQSFVTGPPEMLGSGDIQLVRVSRENLTIALSGNAFTVPTLDEEECKLVQEGCTKLHHAFAMGESYDAAVQWLRADAEDLRARGGEMSIPPAIDTREWWVADEADGVRAKRNVLSLLVGLARAWRAVMTALVRVPKPIVHGLQRLGRKGGETIAVEVEVMANNPCGITFQLDAKKLDMDANPLARILDAAAVATYIMTLCAAYDQGHTNLLFEFPISRMVREYMGKKAVGKVVKEAGLALEKLTKIEIVAAGDAKLPEGGTPQALIERLVASGRDWYAHPSLIRAAVFEGTGMVQCPRSVLHGDRRDIQAVLGLSILVRENLQEAAKTGRIMTGSRELLKICDRGAAAKKTSIGAEVTQLAAIASEHGIGVLKVERDRVSLEPSERFFEVYATTIAGPARHAKAASAKARKR